jgi:hypothetical protein
MSMMERNHPLAVAAGTKILAASAGSVCLMTMGTVIAVE